MNTRLANCFAALKQQNKSAFIPFLTAGYPDDQTSLALLEGLVQADADIVEWGIPFSDPAADGPAIQVANEHAIGNGTSIASILANVKQFRQRNQTTPLILMGYANPLHHYGMARFAHDAHDAGVDGIIVVDIPMEEDEDTEPLRQQLDVIRLIAPTSGEARIKEMMAKASGFVYYISVAATTGTKDIALSSLPDHIAMMRQHTSLPIAVGFGITQTDQARAVARHADGVVVGSLFLNTIHHACQNGDDPLPSLITTATDMAHAIHHAS